MKLRSTILATVLAFVFLSGVESGYGWEQEEHRVLADSAFASVMRQCAIHVDDATYYLGTGNRRIQVNNDAWEGSSFGEHSAYFARDDYAPDRFHQRGKTVLEQLKSTQSENVTSVFLQHHLEAIFAAHEAGERGVSLSEVLGTAMHSEARAQSYFADAFAAGHILSYHETWLAPLQKRNRIEAHNYHRSEGVYVINGRGDVWQTFGDGLLHWYAPSYKAVLEACETSLKEVLAVFYVSAGLELPQKLAKWLQKAAPNKTPDEAVASWLIDHNGAEYYEEVRLPSLMLIPMPIAASWSYRTGELDEHGTRIRRHYPQLREDGLHDPDLTDIDTSWLYSREAVPDWMVPEPLRAPSPTRAHELVKANPNWASVRWIQQRWAPPSSKGLLLQFGGQITAGLNDTRTGATFGLGYGWWDDLLFIKNVSAAVTLMPSFHRAEHRLLLMSGGLGVDLPGDGWMQTVRLDGGLAVGLGKDFDDVGALFALGIDTRVWPLVFTNAGFKFRIKQQWFYLDEPVSGPAVELIFQ